VRPLRRTRDDELIGVFTRSLKLCCFMIAALIVVARGATHAAWSRLPLARPTVTPTGRAGR